MSALLLLFIVVIDVSANIDCISVKSAVSSNIDDAKTTASCPSNYPTLVSCGMSTKDATDTDRDGGYISGQSCLAQNANGGAGCFAHARCCRFESSDVSCVGHMSSSYIKGDGAIVATSCSEKAGFPFLTGCSAFSPWTGVDGAYPGTVVPNTQSLVHNRDYPLTSHVCTGASGSDDGLKATLTCCKSPSYPLTCVQRYGVPSTLSIVSCETGYQMIGCSAWCIYRNVNAWYISNDICYGRSGNTNDVWAVAICCKIATDVPTPSPTPRPTTSDPTSVPTQSPQVYPTTAPTPQCPSLLVKVLSFDSQTVTSSSWDGVYVLDEGNPSFGHSDWIGTGQNKGGWIKYIGANWVISDANGGALTHESLSSASEFVYPPLGTFRWDHEYVANGAVVTVTCGSSYPPTHVPSNAPTVSPTPSPTVHFIGVYITDDGDYVYREWFHHKAGIEDDGRENFLFNNSTYRSSLSYDSVNGWQIILLDNVLGKTEIFSSHLHGLYPPMNEWVFFGAIKFYITGVLTDFPTSSPTIAPTAVSTSTPTFSPTPAPTVSPSQSPTFSPHSQPSSAPTLPPTPVCNALLVRVPTGFDDDIVRHLLHWPLVHGGSLDGVHPFWTFDCDAESDADAENVYTAACSEGYVANLYYNGDAIWMLTLSSSREDYYKQYMTHSSSVFVPMNAVWIDTETKNGIGQKQYVFEMECAAEMTAKPTNVEWNTNDDDGNSQNVRTGNTRSWFWAFMILLLFLVCIVVVMAYVYCKNRKQHSLVVMAMGAEYPAASQNVVILNDGESDDEEQLLPTQWNSTEIKTPLKGSTLNNNFMAFNTGDGLQATTTR